MAEEHHQQWVHAMRAGDFPRAWRINSLDLRHRLDSGYRKHSGPRHLQHIWDGTPLAGKRVLVRCYHGLGDTIQFARFARPLRRIAGEVTLWCQPELIDVLAEVDGIDRLVPLHDGTPDVDYDCDIEVMELPHALRATAADIARCPYLDMRRFRRGRPPRRDDQVTVGLVWRAGGWDTRRNVPPAMLARLSAVPGVRLLSLQPGATPGELAQICASDAAMPRVADLVATLAELDLVISVDTMVAHLAGALGLAVWTLLPHACDWRWPADGRRTIWYPSMTLFHQRTAGDWCGAVDEIAAELHAKAAARTARTTTASITSEYGLA